MTTLSARDEYSVAIAAGEKLTITSSVSSTGYVDRWRGSTNLGRTDITASQTLAFGPYLFGMRFNIVCQTGNISFTSSDENSAIDDIADLLRFGAVGDGVTDDAEAIQAAIAYATSLLVGNSFIAVDLAGKTYGVGEAIYLQDGIYLKNGGLIAVGDSWSVTTPMITINGKENAGLINVAIDCQWKCAGILRNSARRSNIDKIKVYRFKTYGIKDGGTTQESTLTNAVIKQYIFGDTGYDTAANRDAYGLWVNTADSQYSNIVTAYSGTPLYITGALNQFNNVHAYNGGTTDGGEIVNIKIEQGGGFAEHNMLSDIYCDNGVLQIVDAFKQSLSNVHVHLTENGTNTIGIDLVTTAADETGDGLSFTDVKFSSEITTVLNFSTTGVGTWAAEKKISWHAARKANGDPAYKTAQWLDKAFIDTDGRLLIGSSTSASIGSRTGSAQIIGGTTDASSASILNYSNSASGPSFTLAKSRSTALGTYSAVQSGDELGRVAFCGDSGTTLDATGARIYAKATANWDGSIRASELIFASTLTNTVTDRWVITSAGHFRPETDASYNIGLSTHGFLNAYLTGSVYIGTVKVLGSQETGWTASTGTPNKGAYATYAGQTMSAGYVQAEAQALDDAVKAVSERLKAIEDAMRTHGLIN